MLSRKKGTEFQWFAKQLDLDVKRFGYNGRLVVKSDQEDLMRDLARRRSNAPTVVELSKAYDSKSNGRAEGTVRRLEEQVRTMKLALDAALGIELEVLHPVFEWLVEHAADILTKCSVGKDGRTPYERIKGKRYHGLMLEFGSAVRVKFQGKTQGGLMKERWGSGIWLGKRWSSDEHLVSMGNGKIVRARDVRPMPDSESFDAALLLGVKGTPSNPSAAEDNPDGDLREVPRVPVERPPEAVANPVARRAVLQRSYFERFGYTAGCRKCEDILGGDENRSTAGHSERCRRIMEGHMERDPILRQRLDAARERQNSFLEREVHRGEKPPVASEPPLPPPVVPQPDDQEPAKVVEQVLEPVGEGLPEVDDSEDLIPPVPDIDEDIAAGIFGTSAKKRKRSRWRKEQGQIHLVKYWDWPSMEGGKN